jgi:hypothetical protein
VGSPFRLEPGLPAAAMKTYAIEAPPCNFRRATCIEVECSAMAGGWVTRVDESTELGQGQAHYIRAESGRLFTEDRDPAGLTVFTFPAGQPCFRQASHRVPLDRPELWLVKEGDWRGNPRGIPVYRHTRPEFWVEDLHEHTDELITLHERG